MWREIKESRGLISGRKVESRLPLRPLFSSSVRGISAVSAPRMRGIPCDDPGPRNFIFQVKLETAADREESRFIPRVHWKPTIRAREDGEKLRILRREAVD